MYNGMKFDTFTLDNQLQVLAISDERFVKSSAALAVMAGSMQNPDEHLGLAHFLEHMLFLGTDDYPKVGEYEDFLNKNGGGHNAYTSIDHTNYFFDITHDAFEGALQRFSRFFVCPTFDEHYVAREKNAVHSEHEKNLKEDGRREYRFLQLITDPNHPFSKFSTGDNNTLANANRDVVMDFYRKHYSSNLMRLVLMSNRDPSELRKLSKKYFDDVKNLKLEVPQFSEKLFSADQTPQLHNVASIRDQDILKMSFSVPDDMPYWESKPTQFLAHLIGEEGEGSLLSYLKNKEWALGLETSTWWRMFHVRVHLTEKGKKEFKEIVKAVFSYIELLKKEGLKEYIFTERKVLAEVDLKNIEPKSSMSRASHFSASMLYFPVENFLQCYYLFHKYSPQEFKLFLDKLVINNMQVTVFSTDEVRGEKEIYYGIEHNSKDFDSKWVEEIKKVQVYKEFKYPEPNPFIPTHLGLVKPPQTETPKQELYKEFSTLFSQVDTELEIPKGSISVSIISDAIKGNPKSFLLAKIYAKLKKEELNEWGYPARNAGLDYSIHHGYNTMTVEVKGYSQHLFHLLQNLISDPKHGRQIDRVDINQSLFERVKTNYRKNLLNKDHDAAYHQLIYELGHFFSTGSVHRHDYTDLVDSITLEDVNQFAENFFSKVAIRSFIYGNIDPNGVKPIIDQYFKILNAKGYTEKDVSLFENKFIDLPQGKHLVIQKGPNNNNAQVSLYKMKDWSICNQAHIEVLGKIIEQPFFTELRTHQQLGYVVAAFPTSNHGFTGLGTMIQSQTHSADDVFTRASEFMAGLLKDLSVQMNEEDVAAIKSSIISEISQKPSSMGERLGRFTMMAGTYYGDFQYFEKLVKELQAVTASSIQKFIQDFLKSETTQAIFFYNGTNSPTEIIPESFAKVFDINKFKASCKKIQPYKN